MIKKSVSKNQNILNFIYTVEEVRRKEQKLIDFRYRNRVQSIINEDKFNRSLDDWGKKGYS